jgi:predicted P-loop ATPase
MKIAIARTKTSKKWRTVDKTWDEILHLLQSPLYTGETVREYRAMGKAERDAAKAAAGGFVGGSLSCGQRKTETVTSRSLITLDADNAKPGAWDTATVFVDFEMACYSTHSHTDDKPRLRWVIPTDRPMTPDEYPAVARRVAEWLDIESMDASTYEVARLMYWPTCSRDGAYFFRNQTGDLLKVDEVLRTYGDGDAWKDTTLWPIAQSEQEIRIRTMREAGDPTEKNGIVGLFCRTFDVYDAINEFLSEVYTETTQPDRYTFAGGSTAGGAIVYNDGKFLYSNHATDPSSGRSVNAFDLVRIHKFGELDSEEGEDTPVTGLPSYRRMCQFASGLPEIKHQMVTEREEKISADFDDLTVEESPNNTDTAAENWENQLELVSKTGECEPTINNALLILLNDPALKGRFGYDMFAEQPKLRGDVPWRPRGSVQTDGRGTLWDDRDEAGLRWYLQATWRFKSENDLRNAIELAMQKNSYHPVRDYLNGLEWDGQERLDDVLVRHLGAEDSPMVRKLTRKWFVSAVKRVMYPGCKVDAALVLIGGQNLGKSGFADVISRGWFNDSDINMTNKDGYESLHGSWIVELAELASVKRADIESVKTFITKREDTYRKAYARRTGTYPRQCVFFGTTNEFEIFRDRTGNRRFWPVVVCKTMNRDALNDEADQLWAEAIVRMNQGEQTWLTREEEDELTELTRPHLVQDELEGLLQEFLDTPLPENWCDLSPESKRDYIQGDLPGILPEHCTLRRDSICVTEIRVEMCGEDRRKSGGNDLLSRRLANLMNASREWTKNGKQRVPGYGIQWVYERNSDSREAWDIQQGKTAAETT